MHRHHYFFAIKLPDKIKHEIDQWVQKNKVDYPFQRWVHPEDYHITLAFLGNAEEALLQQAIFSIDKELQQTKAFSLEINRFGIFGQKQTPRIFWLDVLEQPLLFDLQKKVYNQCIDVGFELDKKPFRPHITIARKWDSLNPFHNEYLVKFTDDISKSLVFQVSEVVLYETHLEKTPKYKVIETIKLI